MVDTQHRKSLLQLPTEILEHILQFCKYTEIGKTRIVCRRLREISSHYLKWKFRQLENKIEGSLTTTSKELETCRNQCEQFQCICRFNLLEKLRSTFHLLITVLRRRTLEDQRSSFFAGEIIDEYYHLLRMIKSKANEDINSGTLLQLVKKFLDVYINLQYNSFNNVFTLTVDILHCCLGSHKKDKVYFKHDMFYVEVKYQFTKSYLYCSFTNYKGTVSYTREEFRTFLRRLCQMICTSNKLFLITKLHQSLQDPEEWTTYSLNWRPKHLRDQEWIYDSVLDRTEYIHKIRRISLKLCMSESVAKQIMGNNQDVLGQKPYVYLRALETHLLPAQSQIIVEIHSQRRFKEKYDKLVLKVD